MSEKTTLGVRPFLYPMAVTIVGSKVNGKPNYMVCTYCGMAQHDPPMLALSLNRTHHTNAGIKENGCFSVNIPTQTQVQLVDHVGIVSGRSVDKSDLFTAFYGELGRAPMALECPLNAECKLEQVVDLEGTNELFIGRIVQTYADPKVLTNGLPDVSKLSPFVFSIHDNTYWRVGPFMAHAWEVGRDMKAPRD